MRVWEERKLGVGEAEDLFPDHDAIDALNVLASTCRRSLAPLPLQE